MHDLEELVEIEVLDETVPNGMQHMELVEVEVFRSHVMDCQDETTEVEVDRTVLLEVSEHPVSS